MTDRIAVTAATGQLGRLVLDRLLTTVPPASVVAVVRDPVKAADLAALGVEVRAADYTDPAALATALTGVDRLLLISGSEAGQRLPQHTNVVEAAKAADVARIVYTSILHADTTPNVLAPEHKATEELIVAAGLTHTFLRNGWYTENYVASVGPATATGTLVGSVHDGRVASASRVDFADAAAAVLVGAEHDNSAYELSGDVDWSYPDLAAAIAEVSGAPVVYQDLTTDEHVAALVGAGLAEGTAQFVAALDASIAAHTLEATTGDLARLIGRPTTPLLDGLRAALA